MFVAAVQTAAKKDSLSLDHNPTIVLLKIAA